MKNIEWLDPMDGVSSCKILTEICGICNKCFNIFGECHHIGGIGSCMSDWLQQEHIIGQRFAPYCKVREESVREILRALYQYQNLYENDPIIVKDSDNTYKLSLKDLDIKSKDHLLVLTLNNKSNMSEK